MGATVGIVEGIGLGTPGRYVGVLVGLFVGLAVGFLVGFGVGELYVKVYSFHPELSPVNGSLIVSVWYGSVVSLIATM